jgi:hypothetical protein
MKAAFEPMQMRIPERAAADSGGVGRSAVAEGKAALIEKVALLWGLISPAEEKMKDLAEGG